MKKVILDFSVPHSKKEAHEYIAAQMGFPAYYGRNNDALYDMLTSITEPTAVGIYIPITNMGELDIELMVFYERVMEIFTAAEKDNSNLAVIFGDMYDNLSGGDWDDYGDYDDKMDFNESNGGYRESGYSSGTLHDFDGNSFDFNGRYTAADHNSAIDYDSDFEDFTPSDVPGANDVIYLDLSRYGR